MSRNSLPNAYTLFLRHVDAKGFDSIQCWNWTGGDKGNGYGNVRIGGENLGAHRRAYELFCGPIPDGMDVCHACDNRLCVNPDHLWIGSRSENMADCLSKGRISRGARKHLTEDQVRLVRVLLEASVPPRVVATQTNISYSAVTSIGRGDAYVGIGQ